MDTKEMFEDLLKGKLGEIADAVIKKIDEKDDITDDEKSNNSTEKNLDNDSTPSDATESKIDEGALVDKIADAVFKKMNPENPDEKSETTDSDVQKNLVELLKKSGIDPEKFDITIAEKNSGDVVAEGENNSEGEINSKEDFEKRINSLDSDGAKEALNVYFKHLLFQ